MSSVPPGSRNSRKTQIGFVTSRSGDKSGKVTGMRHFGLKDGHVVAFETRETPARGRELTFLQQLLNAQPGASGPNSTQETNPGGGGGPPTGGGGIP